MFLYSLDGGVLQQSHADALNREQQNNYMILLQQREEENRQEIAKLTAEIKALKVQLLQHRSKFVAFNLFREIENSSSNQMKEIASFQNATVSTIQRGISLSRCFFFLYKNFSSVIFVVVIIAVAKMEVFFLLARRKVVFRSF